MFEHFQNCEFNFNKRLTQEDWHTKCAGYMWTVHPVQDIDDLPYYKKLAEYEDMDQAMQEKLGKTLLEFVKEALANDKVDGDSSK
jgi:hypothetical protein